MKKIILGDTINFTTTAHTPDGTEITSASVNLDVTDSSGSLVLSDTISHTSNGTYSETKSTDGWALGPILQDWSIKTSSGTLSNLIKNQLKIVNAGTPFQTYVYVDELESYFPSIRDYLDNKSEDHVIAAYKFENRQIESLGYSTPIPKNSDGFYDQSLRDYNAYEAMFRIIDANQANQVPIDENGNVWYDRFRESAGSVYMKWKSKQINFKRDTSPGEGGIQPVTRTQGSSAGTLINNALSAYGSGFRGSDYPRTWSVEVIGTGTGGELQECSYRWSKDSELNYGTATTTDAWGHLGDQVYVRFTRGTHTGTANIFVVGDKWTWETRPVRDQVGGNKVAVGY